MKSPRKLLASLCRKLAAELMNLAGKLEGKWVFRLEQGFYIPDGWEEVDESMIETEADENILRLPARLMDSPHSNYAPVESPDR